MSKVLELELNGNPHKVMDDIDVNLLAFTCAVYRNNTSDINTCMDALLFDYEDSVFNSIIDKTITTFENDIVTSISDYRFFSCEELATVDIPNVLYIGKFAFDNCIKLSTVNLPNVETLGAYAFDDCESLSVIKLSKINNIANGVFNGCRSLVKLIIENDEAVIKIGSVTLTDTPIASGTGYVYVPDALKDKYKEDASWKAYANSIKGLSEL